jgi:molecular chaperone DnaK (HSP70)
MFPMIEDLAPIPCTANLSRSTKETRIGQTIGLDFGTSFSRVAVFIDGQAELVSDEMGNWNFPSSVPGQSEVVGGVKRMLGRWLNDSWFDPGEVFLKQGENETEGRIVTAEKAASLVFGRMKKVAERRLGTIVTNAVISLPPSFDEEQRRAIKRAGERSGLKVIHLLNEPTAAALWYFGSELNREDSDILSIVVHFGGGTLDVSVVWFLSKHFEVLASDGNSGVGGDDIDCRIVEHLLGLFRVGTGKDAGSDLKARAKLRVASEEAKRILSTENKTKIEIENLFDGESLSVILTRSCFESLISDILNEIVQTVKMALHRCSAVAADIDQILFCGGSTRIPKVQRVVWSLFNPKYTRSSMIADDSIALIAATDGATLMDDSIAQSLLHTNENSIALQVGMIWSPERSFFVPYLDFQELLHPWVPVPAKSTVNYLWPTLAYQQVLYFGLDRGQCRAETENERVRIVNFTGLPGDENGQVRIGVRLNENNEVNVTMKELRSGRKDWRAFKLYSRWKNMECEREVLACPTIDDRLSGHCERRVLQRGRKRRS